MAAPAWNPSDPNVYENPNSHDVYQVADASAHGQWHIYQTHAEYVSAPAGATGWDIVNVTPAQFAAQQAALPAVGGSAPQPITGSGDPQAAPTYGSTGGSAAPSPPAGGASYTGTMPTQDPNLTGGSGPEITQLPPGSTGWLSELKKEESGASGQSSAPSSPSTPPMSSDAQPVTYSSSVAASSSGTADASSNMSTPPVPSGAPSATYGSSPVSPTSDYTGVTAAPAQAASVSSDASPAPMANGASYTVVHGDTMWGIAEKNGIPLSQLEELNPQIKHPELILPGQQVNVGGSSGGAAVSPDSSQPSAVAVGPSSSTDTSGSVTTGIAGSPGASGGGAVSFPDKSSYSNIGSEIEKVVTNIVSDAKAGGWTDGTGSGTADIVKGVFEVDNKTSTDPLKINEKK